MRIDQLFGTPRSTVDIWHIAEQAHFTPCACAACLAWRMTRDLDGGESVSDAGHGASNGGNARMRSAWRCPRWDHETIDRLQEMPRLLDQSTEYGLGRLVGIACTAMGVRLFSIV